MNHHMIWIRWQQWCKPLNWIHLLKIRFPYPSGCLFNLIQRVCGSWKTLRILLIYWLLCLSVHPIKCGSRQRWNFDVSLWQLLLQKILHHNITCLFLVGQREACPYLLRRWITVFACWFIIQVFPCGAKFETSNWKWWKNKPRTLWRVSVPLTFRGILWGDFLFIFIRCLMVSKHLQRNKWEVNNNYHCSHQLQNNTTKEAIVNLKKKFRPSD